MRFHCLALAFSLIFGGPAARAADLTTNEENDGLRLVSGQLNIKFSLTEPALLFLGVDSLNTGKVQQNVLAANTASSASYTVTHTVTPSEISLRYSQANSPTAPSTSWIFHAAESNFRFASDYSATEKPGPIVITFNTHSCYSTLLGLFNAKKEIVLPALLHLPGLGTLRLSAGGLPDATLGYSAEKGWVKVTFPSATAQNPHVEYRAEIVEIHPPLAGADQKDPRFDGFRRNWLNIFQLSPSRRLLSNNTSSDSCGFCYYEYADIAKATPPLVENLHALDIVRQSLDSILGGTPTYGMPGYGKGAFPEVSSDTFPSFLIAAKDYIDGSHDRAWLEKNYAGIKAWADKMLATDHNGNGLIEYVASGNSGTWNEGDPKVRPSNWWDTIGFGHEDAYSNALAYRALQGMQQMAQSIGNHDDADRYGAAAKKLHDAFFPAFLNPATGVLAGWRSADDQLHDYYFLYVNSIAILYGLVPDDKATDIMNRLWDKMGQVGFSKFELGLPGNLLPVARKDYAHKNPRYGGGKLEDNSDGFQIYENGGATACFSYFTIAAFNKVGQHERADQILFPILHAFDTRDFEGTNANKMSNDWRKWDGTPTGYEGFLVDNYYTLLAVPERPFAPPHP